MSSDPVPPPPPDPATLDPLPSPLATDATLFRVHSVRFRPHQFNPGRGRGRFHPFDDPEGRTVATLYAASTLDGALSETVFHSVPVRGPGRAVRRSSLRSFAVSTLVLKRPLTLVRLHGHGLRRLGLRRLELIETEADRYGETVRWAQALHRAAGRFEGLEWVSRQHETSRAVILFGDRVAEADLEVRDGPRPLAWGRGFEEVLRAAEEAGILVIE